MALDPVKTRLASSVVFGLLAGLLAWLYLNHREGELLKQAETVQMVVAKKYIPAYTRLSSDWLVYRDVPRAFSPRGFVKDPEDVLGLITLVPFNFKEPILYNKITDSGQRVADAVPGGRRAFTLGVDAVSGLAGLLRPGDFVDVYHLADGRSSTLFQAVKVLAVGGMHTASAQSDAMPRTVTLALTPKECSLAMLAQAQGMTQLALRPTGETRTTSSAAANTATLQRRLRGDKDTPKTNDQEPFTIQKR